MMIRISACAVVILVLGRQSSTATSAQGGGKAEDEAGSIQAAQLGPEHGDGCTPVALATPATIADFDLDVAPVMLRGFKSAKKPEKWSLKSLTQRFGTKYTTASMWSCSFQEESSEWTDPITFADFAAKILQQDEDTDRFESYSLFDGSIHGRFKSLTKEVTFPKIFKAKFKELEKNEEIQQPKPNRILSIARGRGFQMHMHGTAVFTLVQGEAKLWRLVEADVAAKLGVAMMSVSLNKFRINATMSREAGGFCVEQLPGDVLYIPAGWYHGTWNRGIAIGVSLQAGLSVHQASANSKAMLAANKDSFDALVSAAEAAMLEAKLLLEVPYDELQESMEDLVDVAIAAANRAIELRPQDTRPYLFLSQIYSHLRREDHLAVEAINNGTKALNTHLAKGISSFGGADGEFRDAAAVNRERDSILFRYGKQLDSAGDYQGALELFDQVIGTNPDSTTIKLQMAATLAEINVETMDFTASFVLLDDILATEKNPDAIKAATDLRSTLDTFGGLPAGDQEMSPAMGLEDDADLPDGGMVMSPDDIPAELREKMSGSGTPGPLHSDEL